MAGFNLLDLTAQDRSLGRASVFQVTEWDGITDLPSTMTHLGDTEGDITIEFGDSYSILTLPELTGDAAHEIFLSGKNPVITIPLYLADPSVRAIVNPSGTGDGGFQRQRAVTTHTLWIVPEQLFLEGNVQVEVDYVTATGWTVGGDAATSAQDDLIQQSFWFWKGHFNFAPLSFSHADGGKALGEVSFQVMHSGLSNTLIPDGNKLWTMGDPVDNSIDINPSG